MFNLCARGSGDLSGQSRRGNRALMKGLGCRLSALGHQLQRKRRGGICGNITSLVYVEKNVGQSFDMSAPVSRKEAKKRRKATSPEKGAGPSARGQGAFLDEPHNGESASGQA